VKARELGDPRLEQFFSPPGNADGGVRPVVEVRRKGPPTWMFGALAGLSAILLFWVLESRRAEPTLNAETNPSSVILSAPQQPLYLPPQTVVSTPPAVPPTVIAPQSVPMIVTPAPRAVQIAPPIIQPSYGPAPGRPTDAQLQAPSAVQRPPSVGPALVFDATNTLPPGADPQTSQAGGPGAGMLGGSRWGGRSRAGMLANPSTTVAQGVLIPAVLETGFNSTQAGLARALVSRDVRSFDGTKVLIPRGSRLIGEYRAEVAPGQKRAIITWTRLIRTDGLTITLSSPSVDPVGRGGVKAGVNNHLFERLTSALLQTTMNLGANLAMRSSSGNVVVALPGGSSQGTAAAPSGITPTLSVAPGTSLSIFVAQDLDFGSPRRSQ
jgi:type IV secretion system protein VirB10